jgi:hypothetical protein
MTAGIMARKTAGASAQWFQELTNNDFPPT